MDSTNARGHVSVMFEEALDGLAVRPGGTYVDATFGGGGHSRGILARGAARVIAFDADPNVALAPGDAPQIELVHANFADLAVELDARGISAIDGALFDFGLSSLQLADPARGFAIAADGPLDMRLDPTRGRSAADLLAAADEAEIASVVGQYGEDPAARRIARAIVRARDGGELPMTTAALARLVAAAARVRGHWRIHPATRTFQALRIAVNDELGAIERGLEAAIAHARPGGRIVTIAFHSLEDRIAKRRFRDDPRVVALTKRPLVPSEAERARNPRARSAKLRVAEVTA